MNGERWLIVTLAVCSLVATVTAGFDHAALQALRARHAADVTGLICTDAQGRIVDMGAPGQDDWRECRRASVTFDRGEP